MSDRREWNTGYVAGQSNALDWLEFGWIFGGLVNNFATETEARASLVCLAHNLAVAAALCRAHAIGERRMSGIWCHDETDPRWDWRPGCGREVPA